MDAIQPGRVETNYGKKWSAAIEAVEAELATGEVELSRLLHRTLARLIEARRQPVMTGLVFGSQFTGPPLAAHRFTRDWVADTVIAHAARIGADALIETGAGWGYNLFNIWLRGGPDVPCHAFEYIEAGCDACARLAGAVARGPAIRAHPFDYLHPDLAAVAGRYRRPLVFTRHSIEQIGELPQACIDAFLAIAPEVTVLHFEPVGFQIDPEGPVSDAVRGHSGRLGYNRNLWPLLQANEAAGRLVIEEAQANVMAAKTYNASSLIRWRKA